MYGAIMEYVPDGKGSFQSVKKYDLFGDLVFDYSSTLESSAGRIKSVCFRTIERQVVVEVGNTLH